MYCSFHQSCLANITLHIYVIFTYGVLDDYDSKSLLSIKSGNSRSSKLSARTKKSASIMDKVMNMKSVRPLRPKKMTAHSFIVTRPMEDL